MSNLAHGGVDTSASREPRQGNHGSATHRIEQHHPIARAQLEYGDVVENLPVGATQPHHHRMQWYTSLVADLKHSLQGDSQVLLKRDASPAPGTGRHDHSVGAHGDEHAEPPRGP